MQASAFVSLVVPFYNEGAGVDVFLRAIVHAIATRHPCDFEDLARLMDRDKR